MLRKTFPTLRRARATGSLEDDRVYVYHFPPLAECRKRFDEVIQGNIDWGSPRSGFFDLDQWEKQPRPTGEFAPSLACGSDENVLYGEVVMTGAEFLREITRLGRRREVAVHFDRRHGKGSHGTLHYGSRKTTLKNLRQEIGRDLLSAMLAQLGLNRRDLNE